MYQRIKIDMAIHNLNYVLGSILGSVLGSAKHLVRNP